MSDEIRAKISAAKMGHEVSVEARAKISAKLSVALLGNTRCLGNAASPETRAKMSVAQKGHPFRGRGYQTVETRAKIGAASLGHIMSPESRAKESASQKGHKVSLETRAKLSAVGMGRPMLEVTRLAIRKANLGESNSSWKGGITPETQRIRHSPEYVAWRTAVFERDSYACQDCGTHSGMGHRLTLEAHHVHGFASYPDERFVVDNGKTLCRKCHDKTKGRSKFIEAAE